MSAAISNYAAWLLVCVVAMELLTHAAPAMAVAASGAYSQMAPLQLMMFCFVLLKLMWLKFLVIWRFFRLWALLDGVETPVRNQSARFLRTGWYVSALSVLGMVAGEHVTMDDR